EFMPAGHILGSAFVMVRETNGSTVKNVLFTGDIGRYDQPIILDPTPVPSADYVLLESTYGNRLHEGEEGKDGKEQLRKIVTQTANRGGTVLIPSFAIGRAQELLYVLRELEQANAIPTLPVYVDSPMAIDAFGIYAKHREEHDQEMQRLEGLGAQAMQTRN